MPKTTNPATGELVREFAFHNPVEVEARLAASIEAHHTLKAMDVEGRAALMMRVAELTEERAEEMGHLATLEMGKPLDQAVAEVRKCALVCRHYAERTADYLADEFIETEAMMAFRRYLPLGPVLAVMPWNYPFWQVYRYAAPGLMAGNTCLLKHASNVPQCALAMESVFEEAGFPAGAFRTLFVKTSEVEGILRDDRVRAATLTGSEPAGAAVARVCGELIKPTVLELGGSDAFIVMPSADIDKAVEVGVKARFQNNGQSCIAAKRFIVDAEVYDEFRTKFVAAVEALVVGDPMTDGTDIGPIVDDRSLQGILELVEQAEADGATLATGGVRLDREGSYMVPGIVENITPDNRIFHEEIFGPVAMLFRVDGIEEAIALANNSPFGLGGAIFTTNPMEMDRAVDDLEAGATFINAMTASDPRLPFGGIKRSGYGRELSAEGQRAFCNIKTVSRAS